MDLNSLRTQLDGPVYTPDDPGYDEERSGFQAANPYRPAVIVAATGPDDVAAAVRFAAEHELPVAVQTTGHGLALGGETGVLISTRRMTEVRIDPQARTAWLAAGTTWAPVIEAAAEHGLAPLSGSAPGVGAVSYTLGGGISLLGRRYGFAADHVRAIDLVTVDGQQRTVTADSDPDLFWALRGGRANFGVVTGLLVDLVPVRTLYGGGLYFAAEHAWDALRGYVDWTATVPAELTSSICLMPLPDLPRIPEPLRGRYVVHVRVAYLGDAAEGARLVAPLRAIGPRLVDTLGELPYTASGTIHNDPTAPKPFRGGAALFDRLAPDALAQAFALAGPDALVPTVLEVRHLGGALSRPPAVPNAVGHRSAQYLLGVLYTPFDPDGVAKARQAVLDGLAPWATGGVPLNFLYGEDADADAVRAAYEPADYQRLARLKAVHDPANLFRHNHNIPPAS